MRFNTAFFIMNKQIPELSFVDIEKGDSNSINCLLYTSDAADE